MHCVGKCTMLTAPIHKHTLMLLIYQHIHGLHVVVAQNKMAAPVNILALIYTAISLVGNKCLHLKIHSVGCPIVCSCNSNDFFKNVHLFPLICSASLAQKCNKCCIPPVARKLSGDQVLLEFCFEHN